MVTLPRVLWNGRWWLLAAVVLFVLGVGIGFAYAQSSPDLVTEQLAPVFDRVGDLGTRIMQSESPLERTWIIYRNNAQALSIMVIGGLAMGIVPALGLFANGLIAGIVVGLSSRLAPHIQGPWEIVLALAPHGVLELPAIWLGAAWSMKLGLSWLAAGAAGRRWEVFRQTARETVLVLVLSMALLLVAAAIEGNLTLAIVRGMRT